MVHLEVTYAPLVIDQHVRAGTARRRRLLVLAGVLAFLAAVIALFAGGGSKPVQYDVSLVERRTIQHEDEATESLRSAKLAESLSMSWRRSRALYYVLRSGRAAHAVASRDCAPQRVDRLASRAARFQLLVSQERLSECCESGLAIENESALQVIQEVGLACGRGTHCVQSARGLRRGYLGCRQHSGTDQAGRRDHEVRGRVSKRVSLHSSRHMQGPCRLVGLRLFAGAISRFRDAQSGSACWIEGAILARENPGGAGLSA
jgi:hypothetical protein